MTPLFLNSILQTSLLLLILLRLLTITLAAISIEISVGIWPLSVEGGFWKTEVEHNLVARMTAFVPVLVEGTPGLVASICSHFLIE